MVTPLIPTVADGLDTSAGLVALSLTTYTLPFAAFQLVSGTVAERLGGARVVRAGYLAYAIAGALCALAPEIWTFLTARALAGTANAFLSPILLAALSEAVPRRVLGRSVGTFAAVQTAGLTLAPLVGGALGELSWRLAFAVVAGASLLLAATRLDLHHADREGRPRTTLRALANRELGLLAGAAAAGYVGFTGIGFLVALVAAEEFALGAGATGLLVASYGIGGMLLGRFGGTAADRLGRPLTALSGCAACSAGVLALAFTPTAWALGLVFFVVGCASAFAWAGLNTITVESFPQSRAGAVSVFSAFKFAGLAAAPLIYMPLFDVDTRAPFLLAAGLATVTVVLVLPWFPLYRRRLEASSTSSAASGTIRK
ncbi:MAG: MFS transporter [Thermoleophilia bacterium]|nr:MFS transporter [Thermoleophilia bacterium]